MLYPLDGRAWADALCEAGFNVWAFDFAGYGASDRYPQDLDYAAGDVEQVLPQLLRVVAAVRARNHGRRVSLLAHSWGGTVALRYASCYANDLASLMLFAPIVARETHDAPLDPPPMPSHLLLTAWAQYRRFIEDVPGGAEQPLSEAHFQAWSAAFLATAQDAHTHSPPAVRSPAGPQKDVRALRSGHALYDAAAIEVPTLLIRGEWDRACSADDANRLLSVIASPDKSSVSIPAATHLMHLESSRELLYNAVNTFLSRGAT